jgi:hypothetical protein
MQGSAPARTPGNGVLNLVIVAVRQRRSHKFLKINLKNKEYAL